MPRGRRALPQPALRTLRAIARRLGISPHTVHDYVRRVYEKLGASSRGAMILRVVAEYEALPPEWIAP
jgi:DNA-binding NarL/FixJ family response regulator